jgi:hypothetical protein
VELGLLRLVAQLFLLTKHKTSQVTGIQIILLPAQSTTFPQDLNLVVNLIARPTCFSQQDTNIKMLLLDLPNELINSIAQHLESEGDVSALSQAVRCSGGKIYCLLLFFVLEGLLDLISLSGPF